MYSLQQATENDIDKIEEVLIKKVEELQLMGITNQWSKQSVSWDTLKTKSQPDNYYFVYHNEDIAGMFCVVDEDKLYWPEDEAKTALYIHKISVLHPYRGKGVSKYILDAFKQMGRNIGVKSVKLDVRAHSHKLCSLYERNGFELLRIEDLKDGDQSALYEYKLK